MVSTSTSAHVLSVFVQNLLDDLRAGRVSPEEAIMASQQYPYLRLLISDHADELAIALQDEEGLRSTLERVLGAAVVLINKELPQFQVEKSDQPLSPNDVVTRARSLHAARSEVVTATAMQRARIGQIRKTFINRLVQNWIAQTRALLDKEVQQQVARALEAELERGLVDNLSFADVASRVQNALRGTRVDGRVATSIQREAASLEQEFAAATQKLAGIARIPKELLARLSMPRPDRFAAIAVQILTTTPATPAVALARAASLEREADAMTTPLPDEKDVSAAGVFFRAFASTPVQKAFAAVADALLNQLSPFTRQEVIRATFSRALDGALARTDLLTERLGRDFVESELFRLVTDQARASLAQEAGPAAGAARARGALEDIIGSLLRGPVSASLLGNPREAILSYFELLAVESRLAETKRVLFPHHAAVVTALATIRRTHPEAKQLEAARGAGFASLFALQSAASQLAQRLPSWRVYYLVLLSTLAPSVYMSLIAPSIISPGGYEGPTVRTSLIESVGGGPLSVVGDALNALFGWTGRGVSAAAFGLGGGLISLLFGGGLGALFNRLRGPREPDRFFDDTPKFLAVAIVFIIILLFIFPSFLNAKLTGQAAKYARLLVRSQAYNTGGPYTETFPPYSGPFPAQSAVASCPVSSGRITQGTYEGRTHGRVCAYDFASSFGSPVQATHEGCVAAIRSDVPNNTFIAGSFGNYVRLAGTNPDGTHFYTTYAHLTSGSGLQAGQCVSADTTLGTVDATGFTFDARGSLGGGTHLHYQYDGAGCIDLPPGCGGR